MNWVVVLGLIVVLLSGIGCVLLLIGEIMNRPRSRAASRATSVPWKKWSVIPA